MYNKVEGGNVERECFAQKCPGFLDMTEQRGNALFYQHLSVNCIILYW